MCCFTCCLPQPSDAAERSHRRLPGAGENVQNGRRCTPPNASAQSTVLCLWSPLRVVVVRSTVARPGAWGHWWRARPHAPGPHSERSLTVRQRVTLPRSSSGFPPQHHLPRLAPLLPDTSRPTTSPLISAGISRLRRGAPRSRLSPASHGAQPGLANGPAGAAAADMAASGGRRQHGVTSVAPGPPVAGEAPPHRGAAGIPRKTVRHACLVSSPITGDEEPQWPQSGVRSGGRHRRSVPSPQQCRWP